MTPAPVEALATAFFGVAILHTFSVGLLNRVAARFPGGTLGENFFHLLGEVEVVFGLWAGVFLGVSLVAGGDPRAYARELDLSEPIFVFVIMVAASTRPVLTLARAAVEALARLIPGSAGFRFFAAALSAGPLLGSLVTEPAAMTVTALLIKERFFSDRPRAVFLYGTLGVLFVNVSIGGTLTHFAAPPVLMVAGRWGWGTRELFSLVGWKAAVAVLANALAAAWILARGSSLKTVCADVDRAAPPAWLQGLHLLFLGGLVALAHDPVLCVGLFLLFLGMVEVTREYQGELKLRESLLVAFFLGGLVVLGGLQRWWLDPLLSRMGEGALFLGASLLTTITDNAALTYLGSQVPALSGGAKQALLMGAVAGGGMTIIANAPNPAGYALLKDAFGERGLESGKLAVAALIPTLIGMLCLWLLPNLAQGAALDSLDSATAIGASYLSQGLTYSGSKDPGDWSVGYSYGRSESETTEATSTHTFRGGGGFSYAPKGRLGGELAATTTPEDRIRTLGFTGTWAHAFPVVSEKKGFVPTMKPGLKASATSYRQTLTTRDRRDIGLVQLLVGAKLTASPLGWLRLYSGYNQYIYTVDVAKASKNLTSDRAQKSGAYRLGSRLAGFYARSIDAGASFYFLDRCILDADGSLGWSAVDGSLATVASGILTWDVWDQLSVGAGYERQDSSLGDENSALVNLSYHPY